MNRILKQAVSAATVTSMAIGQTTNGTNTGAPSSGGATVPGMNQPGMPMGPTKAGPNAAVTGSSTAAGNSGSAAPAVPAASSTSTSASAAGKASSNTVPMKSGKSAVSFGDRRFMTKAAQDGIAEVEAGKLAQSNGANADVKSFGQKMQQDHGKANDELNSIAQSKGVTLPTTTDRTQARLGRQLQGLKGDAFDKVYAREAGVKDHKAAVALFAREAKRGSDPDVKAFAAKTLPTLEEHLRMAQAMHDSVMAPSKK